MATVLITSVGSLVGQNLLDCLAPYRDRLCVIGTNSVAAAANNFRCDLCFLAPAIGERAAWRAHLADLMAEHRVDLVILGRDDDVAELAAWRTRNPALAARLLVGTDGPAAAFTDKVDCAEFSRRHGLAFAPTVTSGAADASALVKALVTEYGFPLIAKPRAGNGSRGVRLLCNPSQAERSARQPGLAIQPYLDPHPDWSELASEWADGIPLWFEIPERSLLGAQVLIAPSGEVTHCFAFRAHMSAGRPALIEADHSADLLALAHAYGDAFSGDGWRGPCNIQAKRDPRAGLRVIETNGRFSGGTSARTALGFDEVGLVLKQWLGLSLVTASRTQRDISVTKVLADLPMAASAVDDLQRTSRWQRQPS